MFDTPLRSITMLINVVALFFLVVLFVDGHPQVHYSWLPLVDDFQPEDFLDEEPEVMVADTPEPEPEPQGDPVNYVIWLNINGMRGDYIEKSKTPFFDQAIQAGYTTTKFEPVFPSLHRPNLASLATGAPVLKHGIVSDSAGSSMNGEPIWETATRQGIESLVRDWPFSESDSDSTSADSERLNQLLSAWEAQSASSGKGKVRLIMATLDGIDEAARTVGCRTPEMYTAVADTDRALDKFFEQVEDKWEEIAQSNDRLFVFLTTDHGMMDVQKLINLGELISPEIRDYVDITVSDAFGQVRLKNLPESVTREKALEVLDEALGDRIYWKVYPGEELPEEWAIGQGKELGDRVILLKSGYAFTTESGSEEVFAPKEIGTQFAGSGLPSRQMSRMRGQAIVFQLGENVGEEWDTVSALQIHPTVCKLLGIDPGEDAVGDALEVSVK